MDQGFIGDHGEMLIVLGGAGYGIYKLLGWLKRDVLKRCPKCKETGAIEKINDKLKNKRRTSSRVYRSERGKTRMVNEYKTTEYWDTTYECHSCGHKFNYKHTNSYRS